MAIFTKLHKFFIVLVLGASVKAGYYTREINVADNAEVTKLAQELFFRKSEVTDQKTGLKRPMNVAELEQELIRAKGELLEKTRGKNNIFVCVLAKNKQICGFLHCKYGHRKARMVEYMRSKVFSENGLKSYVVSNFTTVMESMTQYAEAFYKGMSMNSIAIHAKSSETAAFYTAHGYRLLPQQEADDLYYTASENGAAVLAIIVMLPLYLLYKACDWGIYYKEL